MHRQTGSWDAPKKKLLTEAGAVLGKASAALYSLMRTGSELQVRQLISLTPFWLTIRASLAIIVQVALIGHSWG